MIVSAAAEHESQMITTTSNLRKWMNSGTLLFTKNYRHGMIGSEFKKVSMEVIRQWQVRVNEISTWYDVHTTCDRSCYASN